MRDTNCKTLKYLCQFTPKAYNFNCYGFWALCRQFSASFCCKKGKILQEKKRWKIFRFLKNQFLWYNIYIRVLPTLRGVRKYIFHPYFLTWQDTRVQNVLVADEISVSLINAEFLRNIITLFSMILFIIWTSICLSLFIYTSCHDYNGLITSFFIQRSLSANCHNTVLYCL